MKRLNSLFVAVFGVAALLLAGCGGDDGGGGGGGGSNLPGLTAVLWVLDGGRGNIGAATDGGNAGVLNVQATGDLLLDDGRTRPTVATNFLTAGVTADDTVTYAELVSIAAPTIVGTTATFTLAGTGFELASGVVLDLSDAPVGTVDTVVVSTDSPIIITGSVVTTRTGADAVDLTLTTSSTVATSVVLTGAFDTRGDTGMHGGDVSISTSGVGSGIIFLSTLNTSGGIGDATQDGGNAGDSQVLSNDDVIFRHGTVQAIGGAGTVNGGGAGGLQIQINDEMLTDVRWSSNANGGEAGSGSGGIGGGLVVLWNTGTIGSAVTVWAFVQANGGDSSTGSAGSGGIALISSNTTNSEATGTLHFACNGGSVTDVSGADAGNGGTSNGVVAETLTDMLLIGTANGGTSLGDGGGNGGAAIFSTDTATGSRLQFTANGGEGRNNGGFGGQVRWFELNTGTVDYSTCSIAATLNGGLGATVNSLFDGGFAGSVILGDNSSPAAVTMNTTDFVISITAIGGATDSNTTGVGGAGGSLFVGHNMGTVNVTASGNLSGGASLNAAGSGNAGNGGQFEFRMEDGTINATLTNAHANGGVASGTGDGGEGGDLTINPNNALAAGSATVTVNVNLRGGNAVGGDGGRGGTHIASSGVGGAFTATNYILTATGGNSETASGGDTSTSIHRYSGSALFSAGTVNLSGGNGSTVSGNGRGGFGANWVSNCDDDLIEMNLTFIANGGTGSGTGNGGGGGSIQANLTDNDDAVASNFIFNGTMLVSGGAALGSGNGGNGNRLDIDFDFGSATSGGDVTISGTIIANGGASATGDGGDSGDGIDIDNDVGNIVFNATLTCRGGTGAIGGDGNGSLRIQTAGAITINGTLENSAGNGTATGGAGGALNIGNDEASSVIIGANGVVRANGGSGTAIGAAGTIDLDPIGTGGANVTQIAGSLLQTNDGGGNAVPANITID